MIIAALGGSLADADYIPHPIFGMLIPTTCPGVPSDILNLVNTWTDKTIYAVKARELAQLFINNFEQYKSGLTEEVRSAGPLI